MKRPLDFLDDELASLEARGLRRERATPSHVKGSGRPSFCSNDYLGLGRRSSTVTGEGGATASRLITGTRPAHVDLEEALASWLSAASTLSFSSGYAANVGLVSALARPGDLVVSDALNHASLIDGARLARAEVRVTPHLDVDAIRTALESRRAGTRALVLVESYYSMDADTPDLAALASVAATSDAVLVVDEAHALGVLGPDGRGLCAERGVKPDALIGTLGKALGAQGGFVAGSTLLTEWLWNRARSFVFSTGMSPVVAALASANLREAQRSPGARERVATLAARLREGLRAAGLDVRGHGHIVPWWLAADRALTVAAALRDQGFDVRAIRPPTVPDGASRIRLTVTAAHTREDVDALLAAVRTLV